MALSDSCHRLAIGLRRLQRVAEEESGPFALLEPRRTPVQQFMREPWPKAVSVLRLVIERRLKFRNDQFGSPLSADRLRALQHEEPALAAKQIAMRVGFVL